MDVEITPTRKVTVLGLDQRSASNIEYCAATYGVSRLYWADGYLLCLEVCEKSFEHELKEHEFPISQICYTPFPKYEKILEIDKSFQIPLINVSDMELFRSILRSILTREKEASKNSGSDSS